MCMEAMFSITNMLATYIHQLTTTLLTSPNFITIFITEGINYNTFWKVESMGTVTPTQNLDTEFLQSYFATNVTMEPDGLHHLC